MNRVYFTACVGVWGEKVSGVMSRLWLTILFVACVLSAHWARIKYKRLSAHWARIKYKRLSERATNAHVPAYRVGVGAGLVERAEERRVAHAEVIAATKHSVSEARCECHRAATACTLMII